MEAAATRLPASRRPRRPLSRDDAVRSVRRAYSLLALFSADQPTATLTQLASQA
jgi:hypothetical protein